MYVGVGECVCVSEIMCLWVINIIYVCDGVCVCAIDDKVSKVTRINIHISIFINLSIRVTQYSVIEYLNVDICPVHIMYTWYTTMVLSYEYSNMILFNHFCVKNSSFLENREYIFSSKVSFSSKLSCSSCMLG